MESIPDDLPHKQPPEEAVRALMMARMFLDDAEESCLRADRHDASARLAMLQDGVKLAPHAVAMEARRRLPSRCGLSLLLANVRGRVGVRSWSSLLCRA